MKLIDISTKKHPNTFTKVSDCDYEEISKYKWYLNKQGIGKGKNYVRRSICVDDKTTIICMHTAIMGNRKGMDIDHITGDTLDNQRHNLRHCTRAENNRNRVVGDNNSSGYKGVAWDKDRNKWRASINVNKKYIHVGRFACLIKAAEAYDKAAVKYHGEFAYLNHPQQSRKV